MHVQVSFAAYRITRIAQANLCIRYYILRAESAGHYSKKWLRTSVMVYQICGYFGGFMV